MMEVRPHLVQVVPLGDSDIDMPRKSILARTKRSSTMFFSRFSLSQSLIGNGNGCCLKFIHSVWSLQLWSLALLIAIVSTLAIVISLAEHGSYQSKVAELESLSFMANSIMNDKQLSEQDELTLRRYYDLKHSMFYENPFTFRGSLYFAFTVASTTGYSYYEPNTVLGKLSTVILATFCIPLFLITSYYYAASWVWIPHAIYYKFRKLPQTEFLTCSISYQVKILWLMWITSFIGLSVFLHLTEDWPMGEAMYRVFLCGVSVGLAGENAHQRRFTFFDTIFVGHCVFIFLGVTFLIIECATKMIHKGNKSVLRGVGKRLQTSFDFIGAEKAIEDEVIKELSKSTTSDALSEGELRDLVKLVYRTGAQVRANMKQRDPEKFKQMTPEKFKQIEEEISSPSMNSVIVRVDMKQRNADELEQIAAEEISSPSMNSSVSE